jgi:dienelactone hydrolase
MPGRVDKFRLGGPARAMRSSFDGDGDTKTMKIEDIEYSVGGTRYRGQLAVDESRSGKRPGILVAPEAPGLGDHVKKIIRRLADAGYVAFGMDYHGDGKVFTEMGEVMAKIGVFMDDPQKIRVIAAEALKVLAAQPQTDPSKLAATGYCFGGTTALELARSGADIKAKVLALIGTEDPIVPPDARLAFEKEMNEGKVDWRLNLYGGKGHSYSNPDVDAMNMPGFAYDAVTDKRAWAAMLDLFDEVFGPV